MNILGCLIQFYQVTWILSGVSLIIGGLALIWVSFTEKRLDLLWEGLLLIVLGTGMAWLAKKFPFQITFIGLFLLICVAPIYFIFFHLH